MIGGIDVPLKSHAGPESMEAAVRALRQLWPRAEFENGETGKRYQLFSEIPFGGLTELFVYRDPESAAIWDQAGAVPGARNRMVHLIVDPGLLTVVIDERTAEMDAAIRTIQSALSDPIFFVPASPPRRAA